MVDNRQQAKAQAFRALHDEGIFALPNAWDAGSAAMIAAAGAQAVSTTSAGVSWSLGRSDGERLTREEMTDAIARVAATVDLPVSADVEGGYGDSPEAVATTVRAVIEAGAVGVNLEDSRSIDGTLHSPDAQAARIKAGRDAAASAGLPGLVINARTDVFLFQVGEPAGRLDDVVRRADAYAAAGADSLFVPGLLDLDVLSELTGKVSLPVNAMAGPGAPSVEALRQAGVRRVTVGQAITQAAYSLARDTTARALQRSLLPHRLRGGTAVEAASRYLPADMDAGVGGDWFDVIELSGARVALVVGDVVGHGINAAVTMGRLRTAVRTLADLDLPPDELLTRLDDTVCRLTEEDTDGPDEFPVILAATCLYAVYDPATRRCTMAQAGHLPPVITDPQGQVTFPDLPTGTPLGVGLGVPFEAVELELSEGSVLAFYTDGLVESRDEDIDVGMHRLGAALAQPDQSLEDLCSSVMETVPAQAASDDVTLLLVRIRTLNATQTASWGLPPELTAVHTARHLTVRQLNAWGLEPLVPATELVVSELVTNAIRHGTGPIRLRLIQHQVLTCEVFDSAGSCPRLRHARIVDENGRGLLMIAQLSRRWGCRSSTGGKCVWAEQDLPTTASHAHDPVPH